ncbi:hypothetical protein [Arcanobacterium phocae]|uniref:hypothetical protein n=1 Tax=Arcanobacterium phocae TaxID=131112 RepID=UPI001C0EA5F2|nr:hypothetical protein [Arcanobacterium phocae]
MGRHKEFDQDAKDRVVRLVEDRIVAENVSLQEACKIVAPKLGVSWHTAAQWTQVARCGKGAFLNACQKTWKSKMHGYVRGNQELRDTNEFR